MRPSQLVEWYRELPQPRHGDDPDTWAGRWQNAQNMYRERVASVFTEGTLLRLLAGGDNEARAAAVLALGLLGSAVANPALAGALHDPDSTVRHLADDALWSLWFRGGTDEQNRDLQRLIRIRDAVKALTGLTDLITRAPEFAEAVNQRAIVYFRLGDYMKSVADCERTLQLNPYHFGAQAGLGQCYQRLHKPRAALKAFKQALLINPNLDEVEDSIRSLEQGLGGEDRK